MTSSNLPPVPSAPRRSFMLTAMVGASAALLPLPLYAQEVLNQLLKPATPDQVKAVIDGFLDGAEPVNQGLKLTMPVLGDNPAAVPLKVVFEMPITPELYCEELIILAEGNPYPLACRFNFTPLAGTTEVAVRLRLIESQSVSAVARMSDGQFILARQAITVTAGGCGM